MGLNDTVSAQRVHIGFFGVRNAGKSSLVNAVTGQTISVVSDTFGTTTDPVKKAMELLPLGPVVILDTPGIDDEGELGEKRVERTRQAMFKTNIAVLVVDAKLGIQEKEKALTDELKRSEIPYIVAYNKADLCSCRKELKDGEIYVSAKSGEGINELKALICNLGRTCDAERPLVSDLIDRGDTVILVTPIDEAAPRGRLILPQQMVLRDILDAHACALVCREDELESSLKRIAVSPRIVITDSQVFARVEKIVPAGIPLTSFSILMARYKGELCELVRGFAALSSIRESDEVLICEGCTHHRQCGDIGSVKIPRLIERYTGVKPHYSFTSGSEFPSELSRYHVIVHCGACMLGEVEMKRRAAAARAAGVPMVNYGVAIAGMNGILARTLELFPETLELL